jgi:Lsr2
MAQKVQVVLTCDLDDEEVPAAETVTFGFDGSTYAFELCEKHLGEFQDTIQAYIGSARLADGPRRRRTAAASPGRTRRAVNGVSSSDIRAWARESGYDVSERGRIPAEIRSAYEAAN